MNDLTRGRTAADHDDAFDLDLPGMGRLAAARTVAPPAADVLTRSQAVVTAAVQRAQRVSEPAALDDAPGAAVPVRRRFFRRRWIASAALVAAAATGVAVLPALDLGGKPAASASAAAFLDDLADRTAAQDDGSTAVERMKGAPYWKSEGISGPTPGSADRSAAYTDTEGVQRVYIFGAHGTTTVGFDTSRRWHIGGKTLDVAGLDELPTDPAALKAQLTEHGTASLHTMASEAAALLDSPASAKLRAGVFGALAQLPGVRLDGTRKDARGRSGTRILIVDESRPVWETTLLVQARTGRLLQQELILRKDVLSRTTYLSDGPAWKFPRVKGAPAGPVSAPPASGSPAPESTG